MTEEYKRSLIDYVSGLLREEEPIPTEFDPLEPVGTGDKSYTSNVWSEVITALSGKNACINGILENEFSDIFILYGGYQEENGTSKGFLIYVNEYDTPIKIRLLDTRGFLSLKFDESSNRVYGIVSNRAVYTSSGDNETYFVYFNNLFLTSTDDLLPEQTYAYKIWNSEGGYFAVRDIIKHPENSWYLIYSTDFTNLSSPRVLELQINVGEPNQLKVWNIEDILQDTYLGYAFYGWYSGDTPHFKVIIQNNNDYSFKLAINNGDNIDITNLNIDEAIKRPQTFFTKVDYISIDENNIFFVYNENWVEEDITKKQCVCLKYNGVSLETIYKTIIQNYVVEENYPIPVMNLCRDFNRVYIVRFIYDYQNDITSIDVVNITDTLNIEESNFINIGSIGKVDKVNVYNQRTTLRRNFNLLRFNSFSGYFRENLGDPNEAINGYSNQGGGIKQVVGYTGYPYSNYNVLVPRYANMYYLNVALLFSRNFYNITKFENITTSSVEIPSNYLNNYTLSRQKMYGATNYELVDKPGNPISKNKYEIVHVNFINTINVIDEDTNIMYPNGAIKVNQNVSTGGENRYNNTKCTKYRINYNDNSTSVGSIIWSNINLLNKRTNFTIYVDKEIDSIDLISNDETTIYLHIPVDFEIGNYYTIKQKVRIGDRPQPVDLQYNGENVLYNNEQVQVIV
jgi:hypothetical protein